MGKISVKELAKYAVDQIESGAKSPALANQLAAYLLEERRSREMPQVMRAVDEELSRRGSSQVVITSVREVSDDTKKKLAAALGAKNPTFSEVIDPSVIGGVKARSGETELDLTVRMKLNKFKQQVSGGN